MYSQLHVCDLRTMLRKLAEMTILVLSFCFSIILRLIEPSSRGFYCNDTTIRYPYTHNTVSSIGLFLVTIVFDLVVVTAMEYYFFRRDTAPDRRSYWSTAYDMIMCYLFGYACCLALTSAAKVTVGRLRPHFLAVCKPDWSKIKCQNFTYVEADVIHCAALDAKAVRQARMSFPSGHASISFYAATFLGKKIRKAMT
uniref:Phosphatidic acid phosphatase type 2/haloperoxidase domain-containing protein n=2 Tax=Romanomermis culicivorax TaxID=13658 RepID=A0A915L7V1_ROMCU